VTGTIDADSAAEIDVTFTSMTYTVGTQLMALLKVKSDDPFNDTIEIPVTMTIAAPAFGVSVGDDLGLSGPPASTVTYQVTVMNTSNGPTDSFDLAVSGNVWTTTFSAAEVGPLAPGESATIDVVVEIPADAAPGETDAAVVTATSQGDAAVSDAATLTTTVTGEYAISLEPATPNASGAPSATVEYILTLTNLGDATTAEVAASGNAWDVTLPVTSFDLEAGETVEVTVQVSIPAGAADGDSDVASITATGLGGATAASELTTTAAVGTKFVYLPLVINEYTVP
jgi:uncharacterized membrane protein